LKATGFGFSIPGGAVIEGIQVDFERWGGEAFDQRVRIVKAGIIGATDRSLPGNWPDADTFVTYGSNGDLWGETWTAADINAANFGFALSALVGDSVAVADAIAITVFYSPNCGNNVVDGFEKCDDGNQVDGDCCSATCDFEASGAPCPDATVCNGAETCDGAGACQPGMPLDCDDNSLCTQDSCDPVGGCINQSTPIGTCRTALKSTLILKDKNPNTGDKLAWTWAKGQSTTQSELGMPNATTRYSLCVYAGTPATLVADYTVDPDPVKWVPISTKGYKFKDSAGNGDGITKVILKGGSQDRAKCLVRGKGDNLDDLDLTDLVDPVTVQLVNDSTSVCFESTFDQTDFITFNDPEQFKAKAR
jgi:cysteine-rich repeat protein